MSNEPTYWFAAKRYGWGWGLPLTWQGWAVLTAFMALLAVGFLVFPPETDVVPFLVYDAILCGLLLIVCWLKGEPPRWRWGGEKDTSS
jgi:hypothetical protein